MKITKYFLSIAAAVGMIAGCQKAEIAQIAAPEDVVAPVLSEVAGPIEITAASMASDSVEFVWTAADYGVKTQINYSLEAATAAAPNAKVTVTSGMTGTTAVVTYEALNAILFNDLKLADGIAEDVQFSIGVKVGEYQKIYSNAITVSCKVTAAEKEYPKLTVAGSYAYNNWSPGKGQFVFDFEGTGTKYSGVIDFGEDVSALNFKFVGTKWGENEFSVPSGEAQAPEAAELPLCAGGGDNISAYTTHRFYSLTLDKATPKVIKNFSFNSLGVIGDATPTGWDADTDMQFNPAKQRFYVDITLADGTIKFRADDGWDVNWGGADGVLVAGGDNIAVTAGNYRIYVNLNNPANPTYEINAKMYGKEEPVDSTTPAPEPEPTPEVTGWNLIGIGGDWEHDVLMNDVQSFRAATNVTINAGEGFKLRLDGKWDDNRGAAGDVEPFVVTVGEAIEVVNNGKNMAVAETGAYDIYYDNAKEKFYVLATGSPVPGTDLVASEWGVVGDVNEWNAPDITMYKTATEGLFVAYNVAMPAGGFKIRANGVWNDAANYGLETDGTVEVDHAYTLVCSGGSKNITIAAGNYDIWFDLNESMVYIMTPGKHISEAEGGTAVAPEPEPETDWFIVGNFNNWTVGDANYKMTKEGDWYVFKGFVSDGQGFKFNAGSWDVNRGATGEVEPFEVTVGAALEVVHNGKNLAVAAGTYDIYMNVAADQIFVMAAGEVPEVEVPETPWYLVGNFNNWTVGDADYKMTKEGDWYVFKGFVSDGQGFKFNAGSWDVNRGATGEVEPFEVTVGAAVEVVHNGKNLAAAAGTYDVYMNVAADQIFVMETGKTPAN